MSFYIKAARHTNCPICVLIINYKVYINDEGIDSVFYKTLSLFSKCLHLNSISREQSWSYVSFYTPASMYCKGP